ncbi:MAG: hypothetical protein K6U03_02605 [Firmicutes bacterium]|nr:hypothetical protein [Bacillota bacterium]
MLWREVLTCIGAIAAGGAGFWLASLVKPPPMALALAGPPMMAFLPPRFAIGLVIGAWLGTAVYARAHEGIPAPNERPGWQRVLWDALGVNLAFPVGLIYALRERGQAPPGVVVAVGFCLVFAIVLCYFRTTAWDIPRELRVGHGYLVGLAAFVPWAFPLSRLGWAALGLGFFTFLVLPAFFLATLDFRLGRPGKRRRRRFNGRRRKKLRLRRPGYHQFGLGRS